jgi:hypothetical protein
MRTFSSLMPMIGSSASVRMLAPMAALFALSLPDLGSGLKHPEIRLARKAPPPDTNPLSVAFRKGIIHPKKYVS